MFERHYQRWSPRGRPWPWPWPHFEVLGLILKS